ncbi:hypothetical protein ACWEF9_09115 [Streptomyces sp. NPDC004980]
MTQLALSGFVLAATLIVYGVLGAVWWARGRSDRKAAARLGSLQIDPYHSVGTAGRPEDTDRAAAAELIRGGMASVDVEGFLTVTGRRGLPAESPTYGPEHPIPAALLDALTRHGGRATLRGLVNDPPLRAAREAFLRAEDAKVPRWSDRRKDGLRSVATLTALLLALFYAVQVVFLREESGPHEVVNTVFALFLLVILWLMLAMPVGWFVLRFWPGRRDPFRDHCAQLPQHPALAALSEQQHSRLTKSVLYQEPWEMERDRWVDVDTPGAF